MTMITKSTIWSKSLRLLNCMLITLFLFPVMTAHAADFVWVEGEDSTQINVKPNIAGWGSKEFLSGEKWLNVNIDEKDIEKNVPDTGVLISYKLKMPSEGKYQIWNRIGFEFVRTPFDWRIDGGEWANISPEQLTTDLMELDFWCEVAWLKMGEKQLTAGEHTLEIRCPKVKDDKGKYQHINYASDALCLYNGEFTPNSHFKPGEKRNLPIDDTAAKKTFELPEAKGAARASVALNGAWEVARNDEMLPPPDVAVPMKDFPSQALWTGIEVPGDKNEQRPNLVMAHRLWYRTKVNVPASSAGRSFHLVFPCNSLNTTVFVNGQYCGFEKNPFCRFQIDVSKAVKPGVNEVMVGIRDVYYGYSNNPKDPLKLRKKFNLPIKYIGDGFQDLAYPVWSSARSGILNTPEFVCAGAVKPTDIFVKTSVSKKQIDADITLINTTDKPASGEVSTDAVDLKTGKVEKSFPAVPFTLDSGAEKLVNLTSSWADARLWWPDAPNMYLLRSTVKIDGKPVDVYEQSFGFREWSSIGKDFILNGVVWPIWCDLVGSTSSPDDFLKRYRQYGERSMRLMGATQGGIRWNGMTTDDALDFFDKQGVVVRRCGPLDGEAIGYFAIENDPDLKAQYKSEVKMDLMKNWRDQMVAQVKGERNHPSIALWSIENEWLFINCINLYGGLMDQFEKEVTICSNAVLAVDPTRLTMTDGGGANKDNSMPIHGNHYVFGDQGYDKYPQIAYEKNPKGGGRGRWEWDMKRPRFMGEDYFASGIKAADYSFFGGEGAFQGKSEARPAMTIIYRMLTEGYRWAGQSAWQFWMGDGDLVGNPWVCNAERAVFCRQWDWTFGSGQIVRRDMALFNNSHYNDHITFTWALTIGGKKIAANSKVYTVPMGKDIRFPINLTMPAVNTRQEGKLTLNLTVEGKSVFVDSKNVSVLPNAKLAVSTGLVVFDPNGDILKFLKSTGKAFTSINSLSALPVAGKVLIVGNDAISASESTSSKLAAWALDGRRVIVLEQKNPLKYQALPFDVESSSATGSFAFAEDLGHPIMKGLAQKDLFTWSPGDVVYTNAYQKPSKGARSLVQCHNQLLNSAMVEAPVGKGVMILSQLKIGSHLADNEVARKLLANMVDYASNYRQEFRPAAIASSDPLLIKNLDASGLQYAKVDSPVSALSSGKSKLLIVSATAANLKALVGAQAQVNSYMKAGGYIVFHGLTPEGLASYNKLVGFDHMIRPFWREKVQFSTPRNPLTSGLTIGDIVHLSGERIFGWTEDEFVSGDEFSYVVDLDDVAPFATFKNEFDKLMVNGMRNSDGWKYIVNLAQKDADWNLKLPKPQTITEVSWAPNMNYHYVTKFLLDFDGKSSQTFNMKANNDTQTFPVLSPVPAGSFHVKIMDVEKNPGHNGEITGLDNIWLKAKRPSDFYQNVKPLLNIGAMVQYPRGEGGIVLCNILFKDTETVPVNSSKKRTILSTILRNLKAPFAGSKTVIAGAGLVYSPVDIGKKATQYRDDKGWFGDKNFTFKDLPTGKQTFGGVAYMIYDFPTSPVPNAIMLGGGGVPNNPAQEVKDILVNKKADALFFLQTARIDDGMSADDWKNNRRFELFKYVVHYEDGQTVEIPNFVDIDVADYHPTQIVPLRGAQTAWTKAYSGTERTAAAYSRQWTNPRPGVIIKSVDIVYGKDKRGVPVLLALTAATATK